MNKLRRVLLSVSAACVLACTAGAFAACGGDPPAPAHEHDWSDWTEKTAATCTAAKVEQRDCLDANCPGGGHEERNSGNPLGHSLTDWAEETAATCTEAQVLERHCQRTGCNEKETKDGTVALDHEWNWTTVSEATCTAGKHETATCKRDGCEATNERTGDPLDHEWTEWAEETPADCTHAQVLEHHCQRDGCEEKDTKDGTAALGHSLKVVNGSLQAPTDTASGSVQIMCNKRADTTFGKVTVTLPELNNGEYKTSVTPATCQKAGATTYTYNAPEYPDFDITFDVAIPQLPHNFTDWTLTQAPTDTAAGYVNSSCANGGCTQTGIKELPALTDANVTSGFYSKTTEDNKYVFTVTKAKADELFNGKQFSFEQTIPTTLVYGENAVTFEAHTELSVVFTSTENKAKAYSITVPEGVNVFYNGNDVITPDSEIKFYNFSAAANGTVKFFLTSDTAGEKTVTIGEMVLEKINVGETKTMKASGGTLEVGADVPAGTYLLALDTSSSPVFNRMNFSLSVSDGTTTTTAPLKAGAGLYATNKNNVGDYIAKFEIKPGDKISLSATGTAPEEVTLGLTLMSHVELNEDYSFSAYKGSSKAAAALIVGNDVAEGSYSLTVTATAASSTVIVNGTAQSDLTAVTLKAGDIIKIEGPTKALFTGTIKIEPAA